MLGVGAWYRPGEGELPWRKPGNRLLSAEAEKRTADSNPASPPRAGGASYTRGSSKLSSAWGPRPAATNSILHLAEEVGETRSPASVRWSASSDSIQLTRIDLQTLRDKITAPGKMSPHLECLTCPGTRTTSLPQWKRALIQDFYWTLIWGIPLKKHDPGYWKKTLISRSKTSFGSGWRIEKRCWQVKEVLIGIDEGCKILDMSQRPETSNEESYLNSGRPSNLLKTSFSSSHLEKLYRQSSLQQRRDGLKCFLISAVIYDTYNLVLPDVDLLIRGLSVVFIGLNLALLAWALKGIKARGYLWFVMPHVAWQLFTAQILTQLFLKSTDVNYRDGLGWLLLLLYLIFATLPLRLPLCLFLATGTALVYIVAIIGLSKSSATSDIDVLVRKSYFYFAWYFRYRCVSQSRALEGLYGVQWVS